MRLMLCLLTLITVTVCTAQRSTTETIEVSPREALTALSFGSLLLDVRNPEELVVSRYDVANQIEIPLSELLQRTAEVPRDRPIIVACASGGRSNRAIELLREAGYTNLRNLEGGMQAWQREGLPVVAGKE